MNNVQIARLLNSHRLIKPYFGGVFSADQIIKQYNQLRNKFVVVNLDPSWKTGSHWVGIYFDEGKNEYFDSYGWEPPYIEFDDMLRNYKMNACQLQHPLTTVCGQYCCFYIWRKCKGDSLKDIVSLFSREDFILNDTAVNNALEEEFEIDLDVIDTPFLKKQISKSLEHNTKTLLK